MSNSMTVPTFSLLFDLSGILQYVVTPTILSPTPRRYSCSVIAGLKEIMFCGILPDSPERLLKIADKNIAKKRKEGCIKIF
jgi:hypothetical protein